MEIQVYTCIIPFLLIIQTTVSLSTDETTQLKEDECFSLLAHATIDAADLHWEMKSLRGRATPNRIKLDCIGETLFEDTKGRTMVDQIHIIEYFPGAATQGLLSRLKANMEFMCNMTFLYNTADLPVVAPVYNFTFVTPVNVPEHPKRPNVVLSMVEDINSYVIEIYNTTTKNGPITGYEVQFLPVNNSPLDNNGFPVFLQGTTEPFNNDIPLAEVAATVNKPIGFCYRYSGGKGHSLNTLPQFITVDGEDLLNNTLKIGSSYIIITIAYTQMGNKILYSSSDPSPILTIRSSLNIIEEEPTISTVNIDLMKDSPAASSIHTKKVFRKKFKDKLLYIGLASIPLLLLVCCVTLTYVYNKATDDYKSQKREEYFAKRMKKSMRLNPKLFFSSTKNYRNKTRPDETLYSYPSSQIVNTPLPPPPTMVTSLYNESYYDNRIQSDTSIPIYSEVHQDNNNPIYDEVYYDPPNATSPSAHENIYESITDYQIVVPQLNIKSVDDPVFYDTIESGQGDVYVSEQHEGQLKVSVSLNFESMATSSSSSLDTVRKPESVIEDPPLDLPVKEGLGEADSNAFLKRKEEHMAIDQVYCETDEIPEPTYEYEISNGTEGHDIGISDQYNDVGYHDSIDMISTHHHESVIMIHHDLGDEMRKENSSQDIMTSYKQVEDSFSELFREKLNDDISVSKSSIDSIKPSGYYEDQIMGKNTDRSEATCTSSSEVSIHIDDSSINDFLSASSNIEEDQLSSDSEYHLCSEYSPLIGGPSPREEVHPLPSSVMTDTSSETWSDALEVSELLANDATPPNGKDGTSDEDSPDGYIILNDPLAYSIELISPSSTTTETVHDTNDSARRVKP